MRTPPADVAPAELLAVLRGRWLLDVDAVVYAPVGFGSQHWTASGRDGQRWFVTADALAPAGSATFTDLDVALRCAAALHDRGMEAVVAPLRSSGGAVLERIGTHHVVAVYPYVAGQSGSFGGPVSDDDRAAVLDLLAGLHTTAVTACPTVRTDALRVDRREALDAALADLDRPWHSGPHAEPVRAALRRDQATLRHALALYDAEAQALRAATTSWVLTHGEPHPGNLIRTDNGLRLVDWDTVLLAPPERDLWLLTGDGASDEQVAAEYAARTGHRPDPRGMRLQRRRWALADVAIFTDDVRHPHTDDPEIAESVDYLLRSLAWLTTDGLAT
jgi:aminoglycoside phosphotransferase (APT) family kinase protein